MLERYKKSPDWDFFYLLLALTQETFYVIFR